MLVIGFLSIFSVIGSANATSINVTPGPFQVAVDETTHQVYVVNDVFNIVNVINGSTNTVTSTIPVGVAPFAAAVNPNIQRVYVVNDGSNSVSVINETSKTVIATIPVGVGPIAVAVNPNNGIVYVSNIFDGSVSIINGSTNSVTSTLPLTGASGIAIDPALNKVFIGVFGSNFVYVLNSTTNSLIGTIPVGFAPGFITINPNNHLVYVPNSDSNTVSVINATTDQVIKTVTTGGFATIAAAVNPITGLVYASNTISNEVTVINGTTNNVVSVFPTDPGPAGIAVDPSLNKAYVANSKFNTVSVIDITVNPPVAIAGPDQTVNQGNLVTLNGSSSFSTNGQPLTFNWTQTAGPAVTLSNAAAANPTFTAPATSVSTLLTFKLIVNDGVLDSAPSTARVVDNPPATFIVPLAPTNGTFSGSVNIGNIVNGSTFTLQYKPPVGALPVAQFQESTIDPGVDKPNVGFNVTESSQVPANLPIPPINTAAFFSINSSGVDFSNPSNFAANQSPLTKFFVASNFTSAKRFADNCPVIPLELFNETTQKWDQVGDPLGQTTKIFTGNTGSGTMSVIDTSLNSVVKTIVVPGGVQGSHFVPNNNLVYVANPFSNTVTAIDSASYNIVATIPVGTNPRSVNHDSATHSVYVANRGSNSISVINDTTNTVVATIPGIVSPEGMTVNPNTHKLYVANFVTGTVSIISTTTDSQIGLIPIGIFPNSVNVDPSTNKIYVLSAIGGLSVVDGNTNKIINTIAPGGIGIIDSNNKRVYVTQASHNTISVIDSSLDTQVASIPLGIGPRSGSVDTNTDKIYFTTSISNTVSVVDGMPGSPTQNTVLANIPVGSNPFQPSLAVSSNAPNPARDPSSDVRDNTGKIIECAYIAHHPHLSKFAVGGIISPVALALLGLGGSPGGTATAPSMTVSSFSGGATLPDNIKNIILNEDPFTPLAPINDPSIDLPLTINGNGFPIAHSANTIQTQSFQTGQPISLKLVLHDPYDIEHVSLFSNLQGSSKNIVDSDTAIIYENGQDPQIIDPHGYFSNVKITKSTNGNRIEFDYGITFAKPMVKSDIILRSWNSYKASSDVDIMDAWEITQTQTNNENLPNQTPQKTQTPSEDPAPDLLPEIKKWAGYSPTSISDSQLLTEVGIKGQHIPPWFMKTTKWVMDGELDQQDFVNAIKFMYENGMIK